jgi:transcriptional regulator with XRE-family HTH domain
MLRKKTLKELRECGGVTQQEIATRTGISTSRLSLAESGFIPLTEPQVESVRKAIVEVANERTVEVLRDADPRFRQALKMIDGNARHKELFDELQESQGYSAVQAAVFVLGREYPSETQLLIKE